MDKVFAGMILGFLAGIYVATAFYRKESEYKVKTKYYGKDWIKEKEFIEKIAAHSTNINRKSQNN